MTRTMIVASCYKMYKADGSSLVEVGEFSVPGRKTLQGAKTLVMAAAQETGIEFDKVLFDHYQTEVFEMSDETFMQYATVKVAD